MLKNIIVDFVSKKNSTETKIVFRHIGKQMYLGLYFF